MDIEQEYAESDKALNHQVSPVMITDTDDSSASEDDNSSSSSKSESDVATDSV